MFDSGSYRWIPQAAGRPGTRMAVLTSVYAERAAYTAQTRVRFVEEKNSLYICFLGRVARHRVAGHLRILIPSSCKRRRQTLSASDLVKQFSSRVALDQAKAETELKVIAANAGIPLAESVLLMTSAL
jgi:hypothetical protein